MFLKKKRIWKSWVKLAIKNNKGKTLRNNLFDTHESRGHFKSHVNLCLPKRDQFIRQDQTVAQNDFYKTSLGSYS